MTVKEIEVWLEMSGEEAGRTITDFNIRRSFNSAVEGAEFSLCNMRTIIGKFGIEKAFGIFDRAYRISRHQTIARIAKEIWAEKGKPADKDQENWIEAEARFKATKHVHFDIMDF